MQMDPAEVAKVVLQHKLVAFALQEIPSKKFYCQLRDLLGSQYEGHFASFNSWDHFAFLWKPTRMTWRGDWHLSSVGKYCLFHLEDHEGWI